MAGGPPVASNRAINSSRRPPWAIPTDAQIRCRVGLFSSNNTTSAVADRDRDSFRRITAALRRSTSDTHAYGGTHTGKFLICVGGGADGGDSAAGNCGQRWAAVWTVPGHGRLPRRRVLETECLSAPSRLSHELVARTSDELGFPTSNASRFVPISSTVQRPGLGHLGVKPQRTRPTRTAVVLAIRPPSALQDASGAPNEIPVQLLHASHPSLYNPARQVKTQSSCHLPFR